MGKKKNLLTLLFILLAMPLIAQEMIVKGNVMSTDNETLVGATILVKSKKTGATTDFDGNYSISAKKGDILVFSYIGFKTVEKKVTSNVLNVIMEPVTEMLNEVVAVGYGVQKKVDLTGSVSTVKGEALIKAATPNLTNALTGKMTGVISTQQSGEAGFDDPTFYIRGKSTFGDNSALLLVDGVERSISKLDPNEIESITILKDAASLSLQKEELRGNRKSLTRVLLVFKNRLSFRR